MPLHGVNILHLCAIVIGCAVIPAADQDRQRIKSCAQARKDPTQRSLEARLRNARYLAELTKFRLAPFGTFFSLLKSLLDDFVGHNVDAAAALVETAGRFLYRLPETHTRISNMLEVLGDLPLLNLVNVLHPDPPVQSSACCFEK